MSPIPRTTARELPFAEPGRRVRLQGWVHRRRELAAVSFLVVRDRTGLAQVVVNGAQRLHRYDDYVRALGQRGYPYEPYASYVEAFRRGIPPHGGFAIGLERWVARLTGAANIREVTLFPRDLHRLSP